MQLQFSSLFSLTISPLLYKSLTPPDPSCIEELLLLLLTSAMSARGCLDSGPSNLNDCSSFQGSSPLCCTKHNDTCILCRPAILWLISPCKLHVSRHSHIFSHDPMILGRCTLSDAGADLNCLVHGDPMLRAVSAWILLPEASLQWPPRILFLLRWSCWKQHTRSARYRPECKDNSHLCNIQRR